MLKKEEEEEKRSGTEGIPNEMNFIVAIIIQVFMCALHNFTFSPLSFNEMIISRQSRSWLFYHPLFRPLRQWNVRMILRFLCSKDLYHFSLLSGRLCSFDKITMTLFVDLNVEYVNSNLKSSFLKGAY